MDPLSTVLSTIILLAEAIGGFIVNGMLSVDMNLRDTLTRMDIPPSMQTVVMLVVTFTMIPIGLKMFGGLFRVTALLMLLIVPIHLVLPILR